MWGRWGTPQNFLLVFIDELWKTRKISLFKKWKKIAGDIIILHMCTKNHNHMRYSSWDKEWDRIICHFGPFFALLHSLPNNPENQNFQKMKKASGDVIILNLCNKKHDHMMYAYSDMECLHRHNFCHFRPLFAILPHYWPRKLKFGKNVKKTPGDIILLHMCTINQDHMMYGSWDMKFNRQNFFVILGNFLSFYPPNTLKNENIKNVKNHWRYHHFTQVYQKSWSSAILFQRYGAWRM